MDAARFDAWSRVLGTIRSRRAVAAMLVAAIVGEEATADRRQRRQRRQRRRNLCRPVYSGCRKKRPCCGNHRCVGRKCCPASHHFVVCPPEKLCADLVHCCAADGEVQEVCCGRDDVCGDFYCGPDHACGQCGTIPCCRCSNDRACPPGYVCRNGDCLCQLPPEQCGIGGVGFVVVRRP